MPTRASLTQKQTELLQQTLNLARAYRRLEAEICESLREIDRTKLFQKIGHRSLFQYATVQLGFSASVAYSFISVARKSATVPELRVAINNKLLSVAKASRIVSCMTRENAASLIQFAETHSCRETEREVARLNPKAASPDRIKSLAENLNEIQATISDRVNEKLKRAQSLLAQKGKATDFDAVLEAALDEYLKHHDPVEKALRSITRREIAKGQKKVAAHERANETAMEAAGKQTKKTVKGENGQSSDENSKEEHEENSSAQPNLATESLRTRKDHVSDQPFDKSRSPIATPKRVPLTTEQKYFVFHRDQGRCTHVDEKGKRCDSDRWIDVHHIIEVSRGGTNEPANLTLLCSFHHDLVHQLSLNFEGQFNWIREPRLMYS